MFRFPSSKLELPIKRPSPEPTTKNFVKAFGGWWLIAMSGPLSVPFALAGAFFPNGYVRYLSITLAFICAWAAAFGLWRIERERVRQLEVRLIPKARIFLDPKHHGIEAFNAPNHTRPKYVQVSIECCTEEPLLKCQAKVYKIERLKAAGEPDIVLSNFMNCIWDNAPDGSNPEISVHPGVPQRANLFAVGEKSRLLELQFIQRRQKLMDEMQQPADYRISIAFVTDTMTERASFIFHWTGSYDGISLRPDA
jgi:hypothetical protein